MHDGSCRRQSVASPASSIYCYRLPLAFPTLSVGTNHLLLYRILFHAEVCIRQITHSLISRFNILPQWKPRFDTGYIRNQLQRWC